jgi:radical SAM superfamily enzyme YgiQ (UPF0313 family)
MERIVRLSTHRKSRAPEGAAQTGLLLINPPGLRGRTNERTLSGGIGVSRRLKPFEKTTVDVPPIDILYLAAVVERAGARVELLDLLLEGLHGDEAVKHCIDQSAQSHLEWIGIRLSMPSLLQDLRFADRIKARSPNSKVFVFGTVILATLDRWVKQTSVDYVLFGEPEAFFDRVLAAAEPAIVPGVVDPKLHVPLTDEEFFDETKARARYAAWVRAPEIATLPRPAWHLLPMSRYSAAANGGTAEVALSVQASRGCPLDCAMCPYTLVEGTRWRSNEIERVVDEIEYLNRAYGIYRVRFRDANFGFSRKYAHALADALIARGVKLSATIETSVEIYDEATLARLYEAGIRTITTGVETNDEACMASIGHTLRVNDKLRTRIDVCHRMGFHVYGTYCLGTPEETWETVEKTWRFALELDIESGFTVLTPFPGTPLYWRALREGLLPKKMQFSEWNSYSSTMRTYALSTMDLDMARWWARMETIIPYRRKRAAKEGLGALLRFYANHAPHYAWRTACRAYVSYRKRYPAAKATAGGTGDFGPALSG